MNVKDFKGFFHLQNMTEIDYNMQNISVFISDTTGSFPQSPMLNLHVAQNGQTKH